MNNPDGCWSRSLSVWDGIFRGCVTLGCPWVMQDSNRNSQICPCIQLQVNTVKTGGSSIDGFGGVGLLVLSEDQTWKL